MRYPPASKSRLSLLSPFFSRNFRVWSLRWVVASLLAVLFSFIFNHLRLTNQFASYLDGKTRLLQIQKTNEELREEVANLEHELVEVSNPSWIEKQARERGMIRPEEQIYRIVESDGRSKSSGDFSTRAGVP